MGRSCQIMIEPKFKVGDVLAILGKPEKWLVIAIDRNLVVIKELGVPAMPYLLSMEKCERDWFKISRWDFELEMEVDDGT